MTLHSSEASSLSATYHEVLHLPDGTVRSVRISQPDREQALAGGIPQQSQPVDAFTRRPFSRIILGRDACRQHQLFYDVRSYQAIAGKAGLLMQHVLYCPWSKNSTLSGLWTCVSPDPAKILLLISYSDLASRRENNCHQTR